MAQNRIVVDYYGYEGLKLLAAFDNETGEEISRNELESLSGFDLVKKYDHATIEELKARNIPNEEGYVLRYSSGFRMKVKFEDYCRLHSVITNVSTKDVWEYLRDGRDLNELLDRTPDEFDEWVRSQVITLTGRFKLIEKQCQLEVFDIMDGHVDISKKEFAEKALKSKHSAILFKMFEGKSYDHIIWKMIEPEFSKPFWNKTGDEE